MGVKKTAVKSGGIFISLRKTLVSFAMVAFSSHFTRATNAFCCFSGFFFRRFFIISAQFHFTEAAFSLHFLFQNTQSLFDIIVMNNDSNYGTHTPFGLSNNLFVRAFYHIFYMNASIFLNWLKLSASWAV